MFGVLLVPSLLFLVHFFLLVLGLGFRGGFFLFWGPGWCSWGLGFFWCLLVPFLFLFVPFFFLVAWVGFLGFAGFSCHWWSFCVCFFLFLFFLLVFFSSWFFLFLSCSFLVPFLFLLVSSCSFCSCFGGLGGFPGVWGFSCSFLVCSSCSISSCLGGLGGFPGVWGFLLFLSCFFLFHFFLFWGPGWFSWGLGVLLVLFLFLLLEEEDEEKETRQDLWFGGYSCYFLVSFRRR